MTTTAPESLIERLTKLTPRQREVLRMLGEGMSRAEIAKSISKELCTVNHHVGELRNALDVHDNATVRLALIGQRHAEDLK